MDYARNKVSSPKEGNKSDTDRQDAPSAQSHPEKRPSDRWGLLTEISNFFTRNGLKNSIVFGLEAYLGAFFAFFPGPEGFFLRRLLYGRLAQKTGPSLLIFSNVKIIFGNRIGFGTRVAINSGSYIDARGGLTIGSGTMIGPNNVLVSVNHGSQRTDQPMWQQPLEFGQIEIGEDVWTGANVTILAGAKIGKGAIIGAGSVVTGEIPEFAIALGIPAKVTQIRGKS